MLEDRIEVQALVVREVVPLLAGLLEMEGVNLSFTDDALAAIASLAKEKKTGARGLRSIIEKCMLEVMYDIPSNPAVKEIIITPEVVNEGVQPVMVLHNEKMAS